MKKIRVAFFAETIREDYDGAVRTMYQIINRIPQDRYEFLFITGEGPADGFKHEVMEVPSLTLPVNHNYKMTLSFLFENRIRRKLNSFMPDIIHIATPSPLGHFGLKFSEEHDIPVISIYHTHFLSYVDHYLSGFPVFIESARNYLISMMRKFYNRCDHVLVPSNEMKAQLKAIGVFESRMDLWKRGLTPGVFSPAKRHVGMLRDITGNDNKNILFVSRLVWEKNLRTLISIYEQAELQGLPYNFIIAGEGYARQELEEAMPNAYFLGNLTHLALSDVYASADAFVFPSVSETYGNVVVEAMASGLPCVIANGGGTRDFIQDGTNGFLCNPMDPADYLDKLKLLLKNDETRDEIIKKGVEYTSDLSWDRLVDRYFGMIDELSDRKVIRRA